MENLQGENKQREYKSPIRVIFEKLNPNTNTDAVYGEPIEMEGKKVVPVSKVTFMVGGGAGRADNKNSKENNESNQGEGEGGGGSIFVKPVGVYEITNSKTRFIPTIDLSLLFMLVSGLFFMMSLLTLKKNKSKK